MQCNAIARHTAIGKEFRGFVIQLAKDIRAANAQMISAALEKGKAYKSARGVLKSKGNKEFLAENDFAASMQRKFIQFAEVWSEFTILQIQNVDFLVLLKLMKPRYKEVVGRLRNVAIITQRLVDSFLKELFPPKPKAAREATGWKQTKNGRVFSINLYNEQTGMDIERIAEEEKISRQKVIVTAIALLNRDLAKIINFDPLAELERARTKGLIADYIDSDGIWLITLIDRHTVEPVTPNGLTRFLRELAA